MRFPLHLVLDEVVNYSVACQEPLDKVMREGRRFQCFASVTTQSPGLLDTHLRTLVTNVLGNQAYFAQGVEDANQIAGLLAVDGMPRTALKEQLLGAPPGEALFRRQGSPLQRVKVACPTRQAVNPTVVREVRAAVLSYRGEPSGENPNLGSGAMPVEPSSPPMSPTNASPTNSSPAATPSSNTSNTSNTSSGDEALADLAGYEFSDVSDVGETEQQPAPQPRRRRKPQGKPE